jgi:hypothetical protein
MNGSGSTTAPIMTNLGGVAVNGSKEIFLAFQSKFL